MDEIPKLGYESREGQEDMALDICEAIRDKQHIMIEAGVGIGKSYAYLVPLIYYNDMEKAPVVISTSTILLQEQLINDINKLSEILHIYPKVVLAKGMTHFKCMYRAKNYVKKNKKKIDKELKSWINNVSVGDRSEFKPIDDKIWNKINVKECTYSRCKMFEKCYYIKKRKKLLTTKGIILCNHDLLTVDLKRKKNFERNILSENISLIVVDEAHNLEEKVRNSLNEIYSKNESINYLNGAMKYLGKNKRGYEINNNIFKVCTFIFQYLTKQVKYQQKKLYDQEGDIQRYFIDCNDIQDKIKIMIKFLKELNIKVQLIDSHSRYDNEQDLVIENIGKLLRLFEELVNNETNYLFWIELPKGNFNKLQIIKCPKRIDKEINNLFFKNRKFRTILTSATLTNSFELENELKYKYMIDTMGFPIEDNAILSDPKQSPYNYDKNSMIYYVEDMPHPTKNRDLFIKKSIEVIYDIIKLTKGKTMILFTSKNDMMEVYNKLKDRNIPWRILKQEDGKKQNDIIKEFKEDENSILLGTGSYWEGVSIEGITLSSLMIFRLPFPVPDPVIDYKKSLVGKDTLMQVDVPEMIIKLKQGAGRLIRNDTDKGIITILDPRINDKSTSKYKNLVWDSLPMKVKTNKFEELKQFVGKTLDL